MKQNSLHRLFLTEIYDKQNRKWQWQACVIGHIFSERKLRNFCFVTQPLDITKTLIWRRNCVIEIVSILNKKYLPPLAGMEADVQVHYGKIAIADIFC